MAVVSWETVTTDGRDYLLLRWTGLSANDTGRPFNVAQYSDKTVQVEGDDLTTGITIQGSLDSDIATSAWRTLNDPQGNPLSAITSAKIETILEHPYWVRPSCGAGVSGGTVWLLLASVK